MENRVIKWQNEQKTKTLKAIETVTLSDGVTERLNDWDNLEDYIVLLSLQKVLQKVYQRFNSHESTEITILLSS